MSNPEKPDVSLTHDEALMIRQLLDNPQVAVRPADAKKMGALYEKLPEPPPAASGAK